MIGGSLDPSGRGGDPARGRDGDVVLTSRVRLARNIAGFSFLTRASRDDRRRIVSLASARFAGDAVSPGLRWVDLAEADTLERHALVERRLISRQLAAGDEPRGALIAEDDGRTSIMVNEEDHLRLQVMRAGLDVRGAWDEIDRIDDRVESIVEYAFCPKFGYLTACPTNVGTGLRVSAMLHMPGLKLINEIDKVRRAAKAMNLAVRGYYGEGSEAVGDIYQLSNQTTLGRTEEEILAAFTDDILPKIIEYERHARRRLLESRRSVVEDLVHRAIGTLLHARLMNADEAVKLLSHVRLGVALGMVSGVGFDLIEELMLHAQPGHLQLAVGAELNQAQRRPARASLLRERLGAAVSAG
ncbi:MAG: ATP--guanido phosphotransferase [Planctomycetota bacterium]|nr:MAG: ATP--guanido phosphotransferase [Planctomycetota bacterium]